MSDPVESILDSEAVATNSTPEMEIAHGLDPRTPGNTTVAICGAEWNPITSIGGAPLLCADCLRLAVENGLVDTV